MKLQQGEWEEEEPNEYRLLEVSNQVPKKLNWEFMGSNMHSQITTNTDRKQFREVQMMR